MSTESAGLPQAFQLAQQEIGRWTVGHEEVAEQLLITLLAGEHCQLAGTPGSGRALVTRTLARLFALRFARIHCAADSTADDMLGPVPPAPDQPPAGPLFAHVVLVDDLPRLSSRNQALVQAAMQDGEIAVGSRVLTTPDPYLLVATVYENEEDEPTLEEPFEPRDDRYMMKIAVRYPSDEIEYAIAEQQSQPPAADIIPVATAEDLLSWRQTVRQIAAAPDVIQYAVRLVRATRVHVGETPDFVYEWVQSGAGPRGTHFLTLAAKVRAALHGRPEATGEDVRHMAYPVLRHRIVTNQNARTNGVSVDRIIDRLLDEVVL